MLTPDGGLVVRYEYMADERAALKSTWIDVQFKINSMDMDHMVKAGKKIRRLGFELSFRKFLLGHKFSYILEEKIVMGFEFKNFRSN